MTYTKTYQDMREQVSSGMEALNKTLSASEENASAAMQPLMQSTQVPAECARMNMALFQKRTSSYVELSQSLASCRGPDDMARVYMKFWNRMGEDYTTYWQGVGNLMMRTTERGQETFLRASETGQYAMYGAAKGYGEFASGLSGHRAGGQRGGRRS